MPADITLFMRERQGADSRRLLLRAAACYSGLPEQSLHIAETPSGQPYFPQLPGQYFSVSHSGEWWACACANAAVGLDIQQTRPAPRAALSRRFFHPLEDEYLRQRDHEEREFYRIWTAKESYVKYLGLGLRQGLSFFSVIPAPPLVELRHLPAPPGYELCLCAREIGAVDRIIWSADAQKV